MKKIIAFALTLFMAVSFAACKDTKDNKTNPVKAGSGVSVGQYVAPKTASNKFDAKAVSEQLEVVSNNVIDNTKNGGKGSTAFAKVKNNSEYVINVTPSFVSDNGKAIDNSNAINKTVKAVSPGDEITLTADSSDQITDFKVSFKVEESKDADDIKKYIKAEVKNDKNIFKDRVVKTEVFNSVNRNVDTMLVGYVLYDGDEPVYVNNGTFSAIAIGQTLEINIPVPDEVVKSNLKFDKVEPNIICATSKK